MRKFSVVLLVLVLCLSGVFAGGTSEKAAETVKIGLLAPLTGTYASAGIAMQQSVALGLEDINAAGGINGSKVEVICYDDQGDATMAVNMANKLVSDGVCAILGTNLSGTSKAVSPIFENAGIPYISSGSSPSLIIDGNEYFFRIAGSDDEVAALGAKYMCDKFGNKRIACIHDTNTYGQGACDVVEAYAKSIGAEFIEAGYNQGDTDLTGQILTVANFKPDFIYMACQESEVAICCRQMHEMGLNIPAMGPSSLANEYCRDLLTEDELVGRFVVTDVIPMEGNDNLGKFYARYFQKYGINVDRNGVMFHSAFCVMCDAIKRAGSTDCDAIRDALLATKGFNTIVGPLTADAVGQLQHNGIIAEITAGKVVTVVSKISAK